MLIVADCSERREASGCRGLGLQSARILSREPRSAASFTQSAYQQIWGWILHLPYLPKRRAAVDLSFQSDKKRVDNQRRGLFWCHLYLISRCSCRRAIIGEMCGIRTISVAGKTSGYGFAFQVRCCTYCVASFDFLCSQQFRRAGYICASWWMRTVACCILPSSRTVAAAVASSGAHWSRSRLRDVAAHQTQTALRWLLRSVMERTRALRLNAVA